MEQTKGNEMHLDCLRMCTKCGKFFVMGTAAAHACVFAAFEYAVGERGISSHSQLIQFDVTPGSLYGPMKDDLPYELIDTDDPAKPFKNVASGTPHGNWFSSVSS